MSPYSQQRIEYVISRGNYDFDHYFKRETLFFVDTALYNVTAVDYIYLTVDQNR
jgi:hypothetical protein